MGVKCNQQVPFSVLQVAGRLGSPERNLLEPGVGKRVCYCNSLWTIIYSRAWRTNFGRKCPSGDRKQTDGTLWEGWKEAVRGHVMELAGEPETSRTTVGKHPWIPPCRIRYSFFGQPLVPVGKSHSTVDTSCVCTCYRLCDTRTFLCTHVYKLHVCEKFLQDYTLVVAIF